MRDQWSTSTRLLFVAIISASCVLVALRSWKLAYGENSAQTPAELWFSWSPETRTNYVWGYLSGFEDGKRAACSFYEETMSMHTAVPPENLPRRICMKSLPAFTEPYFHVYVDAITKYYSKYPKDREAGIAQIISELASPPGLTIDQIHEKLNAHPRH